MDFVCDTIITVGSGQWHITNTFTVGMMQLLPSDILAKLERNTKNDSLLKSRSANTSPYQKPLLQNLQLLPHLSPTIVPATPGHKLLLGQEIAALLMAK